MAKTEMPDLERLPERVDVLEHKLDALAVSIDERFEAVDRRFDEVTAAIVEQRPYTEFAFARLEKRMTLGFMAMESRFVRLETRMDRMEQKLDQLLEMQSRPKPRRRT